MAGLVPAIPIVLARQCLPSEMAGTRPAMTRQECASRFPAVTLDEFCECLELLLDQVARGLVLYLAGLLIDLLAATADENFRLVESECVEKHHYPPQVVLHAAAPERPGRGRLERHRLAGERLVLQARQP